jgi:hypothetical protein
MEFTLWHVGQYSVSITSNRYDVLGSPFPFEVTENQDWLARRHACCTEPMLCVLLLVGALLLQAHTSSRAHTQARVHTRADSDELIVEGDGVCIDSRCVRAVDPFTAPVLYAPGLPSIASGTQASRSQVDGVLITLGQYPALHGPRSIHRAAHVVSEECTACCMRGGALCVRSALITLSLRRTRPRSSAAKGRVAHRCRGSRLRNLIHGEASSLARDTQRLLRTHPNLSFELAAASTLCAIEVRDAIRGA